MQAALACPLGCVHGLVSAVHQRVDVSLQRGVHRHANAGANAQLASVHRHALLQGVDDAVADGVGDFAGHLAVQHHQKLVAPEPRHGVARTHRAGNALGHDAQHLIARAVAFGVVHVLEPVEVNEQQRHRPVGVPRMQQRLLQPPLESGAVEQPGQRVVVGQVVLLPRDLDLRGHILHQRHDRGHLAVRVGQGRVEPLAVHLCAITAHKTGLGPVLRLLAGLQPLQRLLQAVVRRCGGQQVRQEPPLQPRHMQPAQQLHRTLRAMQQLQLVVHLHHGQGAVLHVGRQALVGSAQRIHGDLQLVHVQRRGDETVNGALRVVPRCQADGAPLVKAVGRAQHALVLHPLAAEHPVHKRHETGAVLLPIDLHQCLADQLLRHGAEPARVFVVHIDHRQAAVDHSHGGACAAGDHIQQVCLGPHLLAGGLRVRGQLRRFLRHAAIPQWGRGSANRRPYTP